MNSLAPPGIELAWHGAVAIVRLNDPERLNPLSMPMLTELIAVLGEVAGSARCMILTGAGRAFCSGASLVQPQGDAEAFAEADFGQVLEDHINPLMTRLRDFPIPWISSVRGAAAGVGCSLALAADLVIASDTGYFLQAFSRIGLVPDGGSTHLLARSVGRVRAMEMMLLGDRVPAAQALEWGLINRVVADDQLDREALELAERLATGPTRTLALIRKLSWGAIDAAWHDALAAERTSQNEAGRTADAAEGIAAFLAKRPPAFKGH